MSDLRKAAEALIEHWEAGEYKKCTGYMAGHVATLRQALDDKPPVKSYCGGKPNYCTPVDAVNMTQDRVDETAKGEHEPVDWEAVAADQAMTIAMMKIENKREWVGLTDDEVIECFDSVACGQVEDDLIINKHVNIFRAIHSIEAKLKQKNVPQP